MKIFYIIAAAHLILNSPLYAVEEDDKPFVAALILPPETYQEQIFPETRPHPTADLRLVCGYYHDLLEDTWFLRTYGFDLLAHSTRPFGGIPEKILRKRPPVRLDLGLADRFGVEGVRSNFQRAFFAAYVSVIPALMDWVYDSFLEAALAYVDPLVGITDVVHLAEDREDSVRMTLEHRYGVTFQGRQAKGVVSQAVVMCLMQHFREAGSASDYADGVLDHYRDHFSIIFSIGVG